MSQIPCRVRRMAGLVSLFGFLGTCGRLPKARRGRVCRAIDHHHHQLPSPLAALLATSLASRRRRAPSHRSGTAQSKMRWLISFALK